MFSPLLSCQETWRHAGRLGAGKIAESSTFGSPGAERDKESH